MGSISLSGEWVEILRLSAQSGRVIGKLLVEFLSWADHVCCLLKTAPKSLYCGSPASPMGIVAMALFLAAKKRK